MNEFGSTMRRLREQAGLTLHGLARAAHYDAGHLSRLENGRRQPTADVAADLDCALGANGQLVALAPTPRAGAAAVRESDRIAELLSDRPGEAVTHVTGATDRLAVTYLANRGPAFLDELHQVRGAAVKALKVRRLRRPAQITDLTASVGYLSGIMAYAALDSGDPAAALVHTEAAWSAADAVDSDPLRAWVRGTQSLITRFTGDYPVALAYAEDGLRYLGTGTAEARLLCGVAQSQANMGNARAARQALSEATLARDRVSEDAVPGLFGFSEAKQAYYSGSSLIWLSGGKDAVRAREEADRAIGMWSTAAPEVRSVADEALAQVYAATACVQLGDVEQAAAYLEPILGLPKDRRISWIRKRMGRVAGLLADRRFGTDPLAQTLRERIAEYQ